MPCCSTGPEPFIVIRMQNVQILAASNDVFLFVIRHSSLLQLQFLFGSVLQIQFCELTDALDYPRAISGYASATKCVVVTEDRMSSAGEPRLSFGAL